MLLALLLTLSAGEPTLKGGKLLDDGKPALGVKAAAVPGGSSVVTVTGLDGAPIVVYSFAPFAPGQAMLTADFQGLGVNFGGVATEAKADEVLLGWWKAGVLTPAGADRGALGAWCQSRGYPLVDTADQQAKMAAALASRPAYTPPPTSAPAKAPAATPSTPAPPSTVSVELHVACAQRVRLFFGSSPTSGGTWGWESPNTTRSTTVKPGSVICIADERDKVQTCWTAGTERARLDVDCGGFRKR